jgi:hypothetical protein
MKATRIFATALAAGAWAVASAACGGGTQAAAPAGGVCERRRASCEAACESRSLPGSSEKSPELRGEMEAESCRHSCITPYESCRRAVMTGGPP